MSKEIIEAVFRYSQNHNKQLMLIASRNQVDEKDGYVFVTSDYADYLEVMYQRYPQANVFICRDHCGPGFGPKDETLQSVKDTIQCDLENGFDLIHIDLCHQTSWSKTHVEKLQHTTDLMKFARDIRSDVMFEIGTDENIGATETDVNRIVADIQTCQKVTNPTFYVVQTGSLVREAHNTGTFNEESVEAMHTALHDHGVKLKEHNADYLTTEQIAMRRGIVDAVNIAPQLGAVQTNHILAQTLVYGLDIQQFIVEVLQGRKWEKWINYPNAPLSVQLCLLVAGHYHFNSPAYQKLIEKLDVKINVRESIICEVIRVIEHYSCALGDNNEND